MNTEVPPTSGKRVAKLRDERGWTQKQLAEKADISVTFLSEIENDKRAMSSSVLLRLADALGASLDYLMKGTVRHRRRPQPLVIPPELAVAAEQEGWSLGMAKTLLDANRIVVARRNQDAGADARNQSMTAQEWIDLHAKLFDNDAAK